MASTLQFTAISGAHNEDAVCYLLEIDEAKILLDCGSFADYSGEGLARLQRVARQVDAVLLSHPDMAHVGAYPLAFKQYGLTCQAYATQATHMMGALCLQDTVKTLMARQEFDLFNVRDVNAAFDNVTALQYSQPKALMRHGHIVVTAYAAGHTIGGTIWTISNGAETVLYATDFNHTREEHLRRSSVMEGTEGMLNRRLVRPTLLITSSYNALHDVAPRRARIDSFLDSVGAVVRRGGNVLIPVDSAARVLEIAYILNEWWPRERSRRDTHALCLLGTCSRKIRSFAQSLVGWMAPSVEGHMSDRDTKPFDLRYVSILQSMEDLHRRLRGDTRSRGRPRRAVVLAPMDTLDMGFSQELLLRWAGDKKNAVILPQRGPPGSLARSLFTRWHDLPLTVKKRVPLEGKELEAWRAQEQRRREQEAARDAQLQRNRDMLDDDASSGSEDEADAKVAESFDLLVRGRGPVRGLSTAGLSYCMFPFHEKNRRIDDYGEIYDPDTYAIKVDANDVDMMLDIEASEEESDDEAPAHPTKPIVEQRNLHISCQLSYVDLEGLVSGNSLRNIIVNLIPKRVVIVHGSANSTRALVNYCRDPAVQLTKDVFAPALGEILNVSSGINAYQVRIADALFKHIPMATVRGNSVGFLSGRIRYAQDAQVPTLDAADAEGLDNEWVPPVAVGDPRLSTLRSALEKHGITTRFDSDAALICNEIVAIRRTTSARTSSDCFRILGTPSQDFYRIRSLVNHYLVTL
ncbi:beta-lactamase-like protein [Coemansia mojavensis]|nr:beta-lactamase-like protein [Coemansia mojavensis]